MLHKRAAKPFVMAGPPVAATFLAEYLTTEGLGGCWLVAILSKAQGIATHIPHGQAATSPGGTMRQTVTTDQQTRAQMHQLLTAFPTHHIPDAMAYVLKAQGADADAANIINQVLAVAGLSIKTAIYTRAAQGNGDVVISCDGHSHPVVKLGGHVVMIYARQGW